MILITGATGTTGKEVVKALQAAGAKFRVMAREPEKARAMFGESVDIVEGYFEKPKSLEAALKGASRAFLLTSTDPKVVELHRNFIAAAKRTGLSHIVRLSSVLADPKSPCRLLRWHAAAMSDGTQRRDAGGIRANVVDSLVVLPQR